MYVYGTSDRLFVNSTLGCKSRCSYCYLPSLNYKINADKLLALSSQELIKKIESHSQFIPGENGTVISLGCYSECWDQVNKSITIEVIQYFLKKNNLIQFATKQFVSSDDIEGLIPHITYIGQLSIFISSTTISHWNTIERGTASPESRFRSFELIEKFNVPLYLYIKPVIKNVTIKDLKAYLDVVKKYNVTGVVVGRKFVRSSISTNKINLAPIGSGELKYSEDNSDIDQIVKAFSLVTDTYEESLAAVQFWRNNG